VSIRSSNKTFLESSGANYGLDVDKELKMLESHMDEEMARLRKEMHLAPLERSGGEGQIIKLDNKSILDYIDKGDKNMFKFNFDVHDMKSESVTVKATGNKIEVHAKKTSKKGDEDEQVEEYSRTYELPGGVDPAKVTSSVYKDGVLTVALPVGEITF
jgi:HSP20 family molecular chaperone IbpA